MFVCNVKMNKKLIIRVVIVALFVTILCVFIAVGIRFFNSVSKVRVTDDLPKTSFLKINCQNYTDILKDSHEHIDKYVGKQVKFVGFVYRLYDFNENQFVLAREMIISSDYSSNITSDIHSNKDATAVVVGFLCDYKDAKALTNGEWIEAEGVIEKGNYHGDLPVIKINSLKKVSAPSLQDEFVFPPSGSYLETE